MRRGSWIGVVVASLALTAATGTASAAISVSIDHYVRADGSAYLISNPGLRPGEQHSWASCPDGGPVCDPVPPHPYAIVEAAGFEPGTVFEATRTNGVETATARSNPYLGPVHATAAPAVTGNVKVGGLVAPAAASWAGGWGDEFSFFQLQACRPENSLDCVVIADSFYWDECPGTGAVLAERHEGWWLRVVDQRLGKSTGFPAFGVGNPEALDPIPPAPAAATAVFGPVAPADGPPESSCGKPDGPTAYLQIWSRARVEGKRLVLAHIQCRFDCEVTFIARGGGWQTHKSVELLTGQRRDLVVRSRAAKRSEAKALRVAVRVDGELLDSGRVKLPVR